jgi:hypothetical protein
MTTTPQQIDELFKALESTFTNATQDMARAKESTKCISDGVENLGSNFKEQVCVLFVFIGPCLIISLFPI